VRIPVCHTEVVQNLALVPDMIASSYDLDAQFKQLLHQRGSDAKAGCRIFTVRDYQVDVVGFDELVQVFLDHGPARPSKDVADEEDLHDYPEPTFDGNTGKSAASAPAAWIKLLRRLGEFCGFQKVVIARGVKSKVLDPPVVNQNIIQIPEVYVRQVLGEKLLDFEVDLFSHILIEFRPSLIDERINSRI